MGTVRSRPRRIAHIALSGALVLGMAVMTLGGAPPSHAAAGTVTGSVFRDFDGDGSRDRGDARRGVQRDLGFPGVTVRAYDAHNNLVATATTNVRGRYTLDTSSVADGTPLRIEFEDANGGTAQQLRGDYESSFHGGDNGTSVQFAEAGDARVDFMVLEPEDFADNNAPIITGIQYAGLRTSVGAGFPAVVANPWVVPENDPADGSYPDRVDLASYEQVGSVWGTAFNRRQNVAYAAASYKRISDLGPLGLGGIYRITDVLNPAGALHDPATGTVENWLNVETLGVDVGQVPTASERGLGAPDALVRDADAFRNAGKVGIGGIAVSEDGSTLFFVNLFDRSLYALDIADGATPTRATRIRLRLRGGQRPWAVAVHRDRVYVGYVGTGGDGSRPGNRARGLFQVVSQPVATAVAGRDRWRRALIGSLRYDKGNNIANWGGGNPGDDPPPQVKRWNSWTDQWYWGADESVGFNTGWGWAHIYPQAILGSLAFDARGYMVLGFVDRSSVQGGNRQWGSEPPPDCADPCDDDSRYFETISSGDTLVAAPRLGARFRLERNGRVGLRTSAHGVDNNEGPRGGEFVNDVQDLDRRDNANHLENTLGGVATLPGVPEVASTAMDPLDAIRVAGLNWFSLRSGAPLRGYNHTEDPLRSSLANDRSAPTSPFFQKGGGLGAVAVLTREAPVEIGNRVWLDADFNGRQDADEPAIQGAPVQLFRRGSGDEPVGAALASTTTNARGEYYFRSDAIEGFDPGGRYVVVFGRGTGAVTFTGPNADHPGFAGITWADLAFTTRPAVALQRDSNPDPRTGRAPVDLGSPGRNDHTIDAGFNTTGAFQIRKLTEGAPPAPGQTFTFDVTAARNFRGDDVLRSVDPRTIRIAAGQTAPAVPQRFPVGTRITIEERGGDQLDATYDPGTTRLIRVNGGQPLLFTVTNELQQPPPPPPQPGLSQPVVRTVTSDRRVAPGAEFRDRIRVRGLVGGGTTAVAGLYGPFSSRADITCERRFQARTHSLRVTNGWNRTPTVRVDAPGVYTWRVRLDATEESQAATHPCGQVAETTVVAKPAYVSPVIPSGFSGTIDRSERRVPVTVSMPGIGMRAAVLSEGIVRGRMTLPLDVGDVGWLRKSAGFGDAIGTAVIGGHVSDRGDRPGAMVRLSRAHAGQQVTVVRGGARYRYEVVGKKTFDRRDQLPHRYFTTTGRHRLVLVSCTSRVVHPNGHFHYTRYIVVVAKRVRGQ